MKFEVEQHLLESLVEYFLQKPEVKLLNAIQSQAKPVVEKSQKEQDKQEEQEVKHADHVKESKQSNK